MPDLMFGWETPEAMSIPKTTWFMILALLVLNFGAMASMTLESKIIRLKLTIFLKLLAMKKYRNKQESLNCTNCIALSLEIF